MCEVSVADVLAIVGPTATGKTALGVRLAQRLGGEVINADSMQLYRGMDIGTAKPTLAERGGIPHHLLDLWEVAETASVALYRRYAREVIDELLAAGRVPILVGGSGLYLRAVLEAFDFPGTDPDVRARLEAELEVVGAAEMHARLGAADPAAAAVILPSNGRRIVRALEVMEITGRPFAASLPDRQPVYDALQIGLDRTPDDLDDRVDERVHRMFAAGLVREVRELERRGLRSGLTASRALGYAQVLRMFDGELPETEVVDVTARATRRFVRRQRSWFRRDDQIQWLDATRHDLLAAALALC
ncbi:tRNA (adenosine(37)-N6)-dimethylallyltransferase MiaA [Fodinicola feengrottensis]|uniref:tRNA dimethylallyltransferase n=1 Tax=Fodinicola feengrottensis TaxID=435914 RepID=A0ABN2IU54_9ACTN